MVEISLVIKRLISFVRQLSTNIIVLKAAMSLLITSIVCLLSYFAIYVTEWNSRVCTSVTLEFYEVYF